MEQEITKELLLNITPLKFLLCWGIGSVAIAFRFGFDVSKGVRIDPNTPNKFSFIHFIKGLLRFLGSLFVMALLVARFPEFSPLLVNVAVPEGMDVNVGITIGTSALLGFNIDVIMKKLVGETSKQGAKLIHKITNSRT